MTLLLALVQVQDPYLKLTTSSFEIGLKLIQLTSLRLAVLRKQWPFLLLCSQYDHQKTKKEHCHLHLLLYPSEKL